LWFSRIGKVANGFPALLAFSIGALNRTPETIARASKPVS
jgi:hypothetical protein